MTKVLLLLAFVPAFLIGCKSTIPDQSGFLSDYTRLESTTAMTLESPPDGRLHSYASFVVDPVELRLDERSNAPEIKSRMLAEKLRDAIEVVVRETTRPSEAMGSARVRIAMTRIRHSSPILNIHPGTKITGAGLGEAGIEAEIIDSATGEQLWAYSAVRKGNRMELDAFDKYDDAEDAIAYFAKVIRELLTPETQARASATR
jgi:uncharacterized protein DUF3313